MEDKYCFFDIVSGNWTSLIDSCEEQVPFFLFDKSRFRDNIRAVYQGLGGGVKLAYAMKANPWLIETATNCVDFIEVCSAGELSLCKRAKISGEGVILSGTWRSDSTLRSALDMGILRYSIDSVEQMKQLLRLTKEQEVKAYLRVTSGNQFGMNKTDIERCIYMTRKSQTVHIEGIQYYPGTQRTQTWQVRKDLDTLRKWLLWCESLSDFQIKELEFGAGIGVPYFVEEQRADYEEAFELVCKFIQEMSNKYQITYEAGRILAASCGIYVTRIFAQKQLKTQKLLYCFGGTNHLRYHGGILGVRTPNVQGICKNPEGRKGNTMVCGALCSESDVLARNCYSLDKNISVGDIILFLGAGAYSPTEVSNLFLGMEMPGIMMCQEEQDTFSHLHCVRKPIGITRLMYDGCDINE